VDLQNKSIFAYSPPPSVLKDLNSAIIASFKIAKKVQKHLGCFVFRLCNKYAALVCMVIIEIHEITVVY
jgi:hypothetical protein